jgi:hypothetical protein
LVERGPRCEPSFALDDPFHEIDAELVATYISVGEGQAEGEIDSTALLMFDVSVALLRVPPAPAGRCGVWGRES